MMCRNSVYTDFTLFFITDTFLENQSTPRARKSPPSPPGGISIKTRHAVSDLVFPRVKVSGFMYTSYHAHYYGTMKMVRRENCNWYTSKTRSLPEPVRTTISLQAQPEVFMMCQVHCSHDRRLSANNGD